MRNHVTSRVTLLFAGMEANDGMPDARCQMPDGMPAL